MNQAINLNSARARDARLGKKIGKTGYWALVSAGSGLLLGGTLLAVSVKWQLAVAMTGPALGCFLPTIWYKRHLSLVPPVGNDLNGRLSVALLARLSPKTELTPLSLWDAAKDDWQGLFIANHLLLNSDLIAGRLSHDASATPAALEEALRIANQADSQTIEVVHIVAGLFATTPALQQLLIQIKAQPGDVEAMATWITRNLAETHRAKQNFGGIARDWAFGFTPLLDRFGHNITAGITKYGAHYGGLTDSPGVQAIEAAFSNHARAVAVVGPDGIGKTTHAYALAQHMIEGQSSPALAYHQVVTLNATDIISAARRPGELEEIMISLANEAAHAGHIVLFFDNAQLFFTDGPGGFNGSQIMLSIIEARSIPMILAFTANDYQRLKGQSSSLANLLTPVILQEPPESEVMQVLEDSAVVLENRHHILVTYAALREAYRLSGRYEQDEAYPGKALKLLEQSVSHSSNNVVDPVSVQQTIEQTRGIKAVSAAPAEADSLLRLEDQIHTRMINQTHAVSVVANALRRARAGVTNPRRPIGSFLFLGPTGVGKTELAKAVAATYFGDESRMIRLDMSEYQQPDDVQRLLATGQAENGSLLLSVRQNPFSVVLIDEIEKAHPNILNLLLQMLDEGQLTDSSGRPASFKDCVIIATSNAGAQTIRERVAQGQSLESFSDELTDQLIGSGQFKPELLNRFDEMVLFRPLNAGELAQVVRLMLAEVNQTLANQNITVALTDAAVAAIVAQGNDPRLGARPMRRALQRTVENSVAQKILSGEAQAGDTVTIDAGELTT